MDETSAFQLLDDSVSLLSEAVAQFNERLPQPNLTSTRGGQYRYDAPDDRIFALLRCVRIVSGFRAVLHLISHGHFQEAGVILRTMIEFNHDLDLVWAPLTDQDSADTVERRVNEYFLADKEVEDGEQLIAETKKPPTMPRKKTYGAIGRSLRPDNPHR